MVVPQPLVFSSYQVPMALSVKRQRVDPSLRSGFQGPQPSRAFLRCIAFKPDLTSSWKDIASEFRGIASLAVQKGAIELKGLVDGAVHTAVTLRSQGENSLDTPFTAVPGLPKQRPSPAGALDAAISEISTMQGFLQVLLEEQVFVGLAAARADSRVKEKLGEHVELVGERIHAGIWFDRLDGPEKDKTPGGRLLQFFVEGRLGRGLVEVKEHGLPRIPFPAVGPLLNQSKLRISVIIEASGETIVLKDIHQKR
eukprot:jgi/Botrbrau1/4969/Bobra.0122s0044.1